MQMGEGRELWPWSRDCICCPYAGVCCWR